MLKENGLVPRNAYLVSGLFLYEMSTWTKPPVS